jgi:hypothetical protein
MASGKSKRFGVVAEKPEQQNSPPKRYQSHHVPAMVAHIDPISSIQHEGSSQ